MNENITRVQAERYIDTCGEYSTPYEREKLIKDWIKKEHDAELLVKDFERRCGSLKGKKFLELGFGSGLHIPAFAKAGALISGLEVNETLLGIAKENMRERGIEADLRLYDGTHMPLENDSFDYVFATSVLEHVSDLRAVVHEANRILKTQGRFYLSYPNRLAPRETHTGYYFVQYFPRRLAEIILRAFGSNAVHELNMHFLTYFSLRRAMRGTRLRVIYETASENFLPRFLKKTLAAFSIHHSAILKTVMVVLEKE